MKDTKIKYGGLEKRKNARLTLRLAVTYKVDKPIVVRMEIGEREVLATTLDLSEGGMAISTNFDIPLLTVLLIKFSLLKSESDGSIKCYGPMDIVGEVRSNVLLDKKRHRLGICFVEIEDNYKGEIDKFMKLAFHK